jgi:CxxC motif-containing protein (DUF1111 family)
MTRLFLILALGLGLAGPARADQRASLEAEIGARLFKRVWTPGLSSAASNDGLGPLFNARSCNACHQDLRRSRFEAAPGPLPPSAVLRIADETGRATPNPLFGRQLQTHGVPGVAPEAAPRIAPALSGGLRRWIIEPELRGSGMHVPLSLRAAPDLSVAGSIEAVEETAILAAEDAADRDGDGVSGRAARLPDGRIGRFGWKAAQTDLAAQTSAALATDLGLSTEDFPGASGDCTPRQPDCLAAPGAQERTVEISPVIVRAIVAHLARLAPLQRPRDREGEALFAATGCAACHRPDRPDRDGKAAPLFSDLLLHDMGEGLADGVAEGAAAPSEWRTAPLVRLAEGEMRGLLHDGRARSIREAILWHDGEARASVVRFKAMNVKDMDRLIAYLRAL